MPRNRTRAQRIFKRGELLELRDGYLPIYSKADVDEMERRGQEGARQVEAVLSGERKRAYRGTWDSRENVIAAARYFVTEVLGARTAEQQRKAITKLSAKDFVDSKISSLIAGKSRGKEGVFSSHASLMINAFPELNLRPWEFTRVPRQLWMHPKAHDIAKTAVRSFVLDELKIDPHTEGGRRRLTHEVHTRTPGPNPMHSIRASLPYKSHIDLLIRAFPELSLHPSEFKEAPHHFWAGKAGEERRRRAYRLFLKRQGLNPSDPGITHSIFRESNMTGMFRGRAFSDLATTAGDITKEDLIKHPTKGKWRTNVRGARKNTKKK